MTFEQYREWMLDYATFFGIADDRGLEMLVSWWQRIGGVACDRKRLDYARQYVETRKPRFLADHASTFFAAFDTYRGLKGGETAAAQQALFDNWKRETLSPAETRRRLDEACRKLGFRTITERRKACDSKSETSAPALASAGPSCTSKRA